MKIFVTGASSYVGKYVILKFLSKGFNVLSTSRTNPNLKQKNHKWIRHDLSKKKINLKDFKPDIIVHLAGLAWMNRPSAGYIKSNILVTKNLVESLKKTKVKNFFYFSSRDIYGNFEGKVLMENSKINNPGIYGLSKLISEKIILEKFNAIILRLPSIIGLGTHGWVDSVVKKLKKNKKIELSNYKFNNFIHASELPNIILALYKSRVKSGVFLVSCSNIIQSKNVVKILKTKLKSNSNLKIYRNRKSNYTISSKKLRKYYKTISVQNVLKIFTGELNTKKMHIS